MLKKIVVVFPFFIFSNVSFAQNSNLVTDFKQTQVVVSKEFQKCSKDRILGNCVAIALIKCALGQFGSLENIYKEFSKSDDGTFSITFNDNVKVQLSGNDIQLVKELSGIEPEVEGKYYESAIILYASICKRILVAKQEYDSRSCIQNYKNAVELLNSGFPTKTAYKLLGFQKENIAIPELNKNENAIIWCSAHAAYASEGTQDLLGKAIPLKNKKMRNLARYSRIKGAYKLVKTEILASK